MALRLARYFGTSAEFWLGLQQDYEFGYGPGHRRGPNRTRCASPSQLNWTAAGTNDRVRQLVRARRQSGGSDPDPGTMSRSDLAV